MAISIKNNRLHLRCRYAIVNWVASFAATVLVMFAVAKFWIDAGDKFPHAFLIPCTGLFLVVVLYKLWRSAMKERIVALDINRDAGTLYIDRKGLLFFEERELAINDIERIEFRTLSSSSEGLFYCAAFVLSDGGEVAFANGIVRNWVVSPAEKVVRFLQPVRGELRLLEISN